jgi:hypothetical protein
MASEYNKYNNELQSTEQKLKKLTDAYVDGAVSEEAYKTLKTEYENKIIELKKLIEERELKIKSELKKLEEEEANIKRELELLEAKKIIGDITERQYLDERKNLEKKLGDLNEARKHAIEYGRTPTPNIMLPTSHPSKLNITKPFAILLVIYVLSSAFIGAYFYGENKMLTMKLNDTTGRLNMAMDEVNRLTNHVSTLRSQVDELSRFKLRRPTFNELTAFLSADDTDKQRYVRDVYVCIHFAQRLQYNAKMRGLNISYVIVNFKYVFDYSHAFNGAILDDGRHVYIEPQYDKIFNTIEELLTDLRGGFPDFKILNMVEVWP